MIKFERYEVLNMHNAMRGARNPLNSWARSDSEIVDGEFKFGPNDLDLAKRLCKSGSDHRKFVRQIFVSVDITAPIYWWKEYDTYKVGTIAMSESTMHNVCDKPFEMSDFSHEHLGNVDVSIFKPGNTSAGKYVVDTKDDIKYIIEKLNVYRDGYLYYKNNNYFEMAKLFWWQIIQLLPSSYNQHRTVVLNYENIGAMYYDRMCHKLDEWREFCDWVINNLPHPEIIMGTALPHYHHANNIMYDGVWKKLSDILEEALRSDMSKEQLMKVINSSAEMTEAMKTPENGGMIL
jgi:hypothetical protein